MQRVVFSLLVLLSVMLYFTVSLMDPGFVHSVKQPMRAKHCQSCKHCVRGFDHHCPWIENCVGVRNHCKFIIYLAVQLLALLWALQIACSGFHSAATWKLWLSVNGFLLAALCVVGVLSMVCWSSLGCHLYLISINPPLGVHVPPPALLPEELH
ncbi:unnamed protein product [Coregonus sp. 'balchen']|nr:unnamed protein product [Coregonus sp. 'balchen']